MTPTAFIETARSPLARELLTNDPVPIVVDLRAGPDDPVPAGLLDTLTPVPRVLIAITGDDRVPTPGTLAAALDVTVTDDEGAREVVDLAMTNPVAAAALALLLRGSEDRPIAAGLVAESATYSTLQAGLEHVAWLEGRTRRDRPAETDPAVRIDRERNRLLLTLARSHVRNAFDTRNVLIGLLDGLAIAAADPEIEEVHLTGEGPSFCSGGDLDEFGTRADPASAHLLRLTRSAGLAIATLADRVTVHVHGSCVGAGVELPAFASHVVAARGSTFLLPEVQMGLVPGAGGTVSLPRRIGRHRTAWLALVGRPIDATTALDWGLVDSLQ